LSLFPNTSDVVSFSFPAKDLLNENNTLELLFIGEDIQGLGREKRRKRTEDERARE